MPQRMPSRRLIASFASMPFDQSGNALGVSVAAAGELNVFYDAVLHFHIDGLGTDTFLSYIP